MTPPATTAPTWQTTTEVAARIRRDPSGVRRAAESGELHGHQRIRDGRPIRGSRWTFSTTAVDAFVQGHDERTQREACGCTRHLRAVRRAG